MPSTNSASALNGAVDVLLICALKDEYDQVREVTDGLLDPGWVENYGPSGWIVADGCFATASGAQLRIRTTWAEHMGREQAQAVASFLIQAQPARCIAMSGICAGRRDKVALGDVIFAERLWSYDAGKMRVENGEQHFEGDPLHYRPRPGWVQRMQHLRISPDTPWLTLRPSLPLEHQEDWILLRLLAGEDPRSSVDRKDACPDWDKALRRLWQRKWLENPLTLTDLGRARAEELNLLYFGKLPAPAAFQTHIAPVATGASVTEDTGIFPRLANSMRKVLGVEMEASALGALGELYNVPVVVAKGVSDYGDPFKDDRYRLFAARASAECLIVLLRGAADLITIGDSIQAIDGMEPATPTPAAGPLIMELPHHRPQQPTLSLASSGPVLLGDYRASRELSSTTSEAVPEDSRKREPAEATSLSNDRKQDLYNSLSHVLGFLLESTDGNVVHWSKDPQHAATLQAQDARLREINEAIAARTYQITPLQRKAVIEAAHQSHETLLSLHSVAFQLSPRHGLLWASITKSVALLAKLFPHHPTEADNRPKPLVVGNDEFSLYFPELMEQLLQFVEAFLNTSVRPRPSSVVPPEHSPYATATGSSTADRSSSDNPHPRAGTGPIRSSRQLPETSKTAPTRASIRKLLDEVLPLDTEIDALCIDHFPEVQREFTAGMLRTHKVNLLLQKRGTAEILDGLRRHAPVDFQNHEGLIEYE